MVTREKSGQRAACHSFKKGVMFMTIDLVLILLILTVLDSILKIDIKK